MTLRPPSPDYTIARYTTTALVKERLTIPATDTTRDAEILQAIIAAEWAIDTFCGRGFPDIGSAVLQGVWKSVGTTLAAADGQISATTVILVELRKVDADAIDHSALDVTDVDQILVTPDFIFDVTGLVDATDLWTFSGTIATGTFPLSGLQDVALLVPAPPSLAGITIVPKAVEVAALDLAIAFWKEADSPTGTAGSDSFFGAISTAETTRMMLQRHPGLTGFRVSWGVA